MIGIFRLVVPLWAILCVVLGTPLPSLGAAPDADIVFITQVPQPADFATIGSTFGNQRASIDSVPRGGDLYIRYRDGSLKNLTLAAGYGVSGLQGATSIAVRDPSVHWNGQKVIFSMVIGNATHQYHYLSYRWQMYEITRLGKNETPLITKVANQPVDFNNVMPIYGTDDRIIFVSDRPRNGAAHLYPQRDEYESTATNSGLWSLDSSNGELFLMDHAPSGDFNPILDSFGRVIFTRWDHLQRDQQKDGGGYGTFNYSSESTDSVATSSEAEVYPEPRSNNDADKKPNLNRHTINQFFPWQINEDGTGHETLNHIGRHELHDYFDKSFNDDSNLTEFNDGLVSRANQNTIENFFQIREDPLHPGNYFGIDCPEFSTHASGQIIKINGAPTVNPDQMQISYITSRDTASYTTTPGPLHTGLYRNPLPLNDGSLVAVHTAETRADENIGTSTAPLSRYDYRIKLLSQVGGYFQPSTILTAGISKSISYWSPDQLITYSGNLWELQPVELIARSRPARRSQDLDPIEASVFDDAAVNVADFKQYLKENDFALIVSRNITSRDKADQQQPFNLRVPGGSAQTVGASGKVYDVSALQLFQGDQIRGYDGPQSPSDGRRVLAQPAHDAIDANPINSNDPAASVHIGNDGSMAAIVPARRALTWQLTAPNGSGVVRERYWLTFQPGEIRLCASCHGVNTADQAGHSPPTNKPDALAQLLGFWKGNPNGAPVPQFGATVQGRDKANKYKRGKLLSGKAAFLSLTGKNSAAANRTLRIDLAVNGVSCAAPLKALTTNSSGNGKVSGKAPKTKRTAKLTFKVSRNGTTLIRASARLSPPGASVQGKLVAKERNAICAAFGKW